MITVHHLNNSRSQRILWLLEELGLPYEIIAYQRDPETMLAPESLRAVHPLGKSPVVTFDGHTLAESGAIIQLLLEQHTDGALLPQRGTEAYNQHVYWLHYAEGSLMPPLLMQLIFDKLKGPPVPWIIRPVAKGLAAAVEKSFINPRVKENMAFIDKHLAKTGWFAGDALTGADIQMSFPLEAAFTRVNMQPYANIEAFIKKVHARPAYQRALERGGPYDYA